MSFIREFNRKLVIILSLIMILIFIYLFAVVENVYFILFSRTITGIFQVKINKNSHFWQFISLYGAINSGHTRVNQQ